MESLSVERGAERVHHGASLVEQGPVLGGELTGLGGRSPEVLGDHGQAALGQVAQVVGQVRVDARSNRVVGVIAVLAEGNLAQQEETQLIQAVFADQRVRVDHVAHRLGHLLALVEQESVGVHALG